MTWKENKRLGHPNNQVFDDGNFQALRQLEQMLKPEQGAWITSRYSCRDRKS